MRIGYRGVARIEGAAYIKTGVSDEMSNHRRGKKQRTGTPDEETACISEAMDRARWRDEDGALPLRGFRHSYHVRDLDARPLPAPLFIDDGGPLAELHRKLFASDWPVDLALRLAVHVLEAHGHRGPFIVQDPGMPPLAGGGASREAIAGCMPANGGAACSTAAQIIEWAAYLNQFLTGDGDPNGAAIAVWWSLADLARDHGRLEAMLYSDTDVRTHRGRQRVAKHSGTKSGEARRDSYAPARDKAIQIWEASGRRLSAPQVLIKLKPWLNDNPIEEGGEQKTIVSEGWVKKLIRDHKKSQPDPK